MSFVFSDLINWDSEIVLLSFTIIIYLTLKAIRAYLRKQSEIYEHDLND